MHCLTLSATKNEHVAGILAQDQKIRIGGTRQTIELKGHAVAVLLKLEVQEYDLLILTADEEEHVAPILALEQMVSLRRTKKMELRDYAANLLPKLEILEGTVLEELTLGAKKNEHVARILAQELKIPIGGIQKIELRDYAVVVLLKLKIQEGGMLEALILAAENREHVTPVLEQRQMVSVGGIQKMELSNYAVCILPKLEVREGGELEELVLGAWRKEHITEILSMEDESINVWDVAVVISGGCQREIHKKLKGTNIAIMPVE
ncbi:MAG: uncharacterized protein A8A55_2417 [Amphiamblys sp. WSBS2006]|nr:MAG: uncharacterized protein A8A55_2417 [Amphiamblys sp. WSBS2006]